MGAKHTIGAKFNADALGQRTMDLNGLHGQIANSGIHRAGSWGFRNAGIFKKDMVYRFTVSGHHHKGHVYIELDFMDTFNIYYVSTHNNLKKIRTGIYIDQLIEILDEDIERLESYTC